MLICMYVPPKIQNIGKISSPNTHNQPTYPANIHFSTLQLLGGGFNPFEKYESNWIISPGKGNFFFKKIKPPTRLCFFIGFST